ncbi:hypothetical protein [Geobacter grbiciae]|uniref:hypothetical protein n=1 Tax=Geobacter grbiciae TaxID=155042 RepID=UPI001C031013|nr:hypothetical protein [Geobacter grbiciae]
MDSVNDRYGDFSVTFGSLLDYEEKGSFVISPAWRSEGIRNVDVKFDPVGTSVWKERATYDVASPW